MYSDADGPFGLPPPPARSYPPPNGPGDQFEHQRRYPPPLGAASVNRDLTSSAQLEWQTTEELILRSVNFHGQQLASFMKEVPVMRQIETKKIDYHLYQQRSRDLKLEDRGKRLLLHRFIAQKAEKLFQQGADARTSRRRLENDQTEDHAALLPPLEVFANVTQEERAKEFFKAMEVGDTLYCQVQHKTTSGLILTVLALDPVTGKSRYIEDVKIRGFCPTAEMVPAVDPRTPNRSYENDDIVRVAVLELKPESERFLAGMQTESLPPDLQTIVKLGLVPSTDLPSSLKAARQAQSGGLRYEECLSASIGFINPNNVAHLTAELGLDNTSSFMADLDGKYPAKHYASALKKAQNSKWAYKHVHNGIKHFKSNNKIEAFQCLNQALNIDPLNVEGLVARGALYANNNGLEKAIEDFEAALKINSAHQNAKKYLCETLIAVGRNFEDDKKFTDALKTYERIVRIAPDHKEANDSILFLHEGRAQDNPPEGYHGGAGGGPPNPDLEDRSDKKKRKRHKSGGSVSSCSSEEQLRGHAPKKAKEREDRSLSPLSRRAAQESLNLQQQQHHPPPPNQGGGAPPPLSAYANHNPAADSPARGTISVLSSSSDQPRPNIDLSRPPPGFAPPVRPSHPAQQYPDYAQRKMEDDAYNDKVEWFLRQTQAPRPTDRRSGGGATNRYSSRRSRSRGRRSRSRGRRSRSGSRGRGRRDQEGRDGSRDDLRGIHHGTRRERQEEDDRRRDDDRSRYETEQRQHEGRRNEEVRRIKDEVESSGTVKQERENSREGDGETKHISIVKEEKEKTSSHEKKKKKSDRSRSKKSLSPLLGLVEDEELKKKLKEHLASAEKSEEKKKKKKKSKSRSRSKNRGKEKKKDKNKDETIEVRTSSEDDSSRKKKKKKKDSSPKRNYSPSPPPKSSEKKEKSESKSEQGSALNRLSVPNKSKSQGGIWIPTGEDSIQQSIHNVVMRMEAQTENLKLQKKIESRKPQAEPAPKESPNKFDPKKKISMSLEAPAPAKDFEVTYDARIGMYIRVPKQAPVQTKAEEIANKKKSRMDLEKKKKKMVDSDASDDIRVEEQRIIRSVASPEKSKSRSRERRRRSSSKSNRSRSQSKRRSRRSRSRSKSKGRRSKSKSRRSRSRSRGRDKSRSKERRRSRSRSRGHRSRSRGHRRSRSRDKGRRSGGDLKDEIQRFGNRRSGGHDRRDFYDDRSGRDSGRKKEDRERAEYDSRLTDMRDETNRLKIEREAIEREKAALMADTRLIGDPLSGLDSVMDSVLDVVRAKDIKKEKKVKSELPEPENVADFLKRKKSEKSAK